MVDLELDALKKEFLEEAAEKVREIETTLTQQRDAETLDRLAYLAHQLKGSGGSYGYQRISTDGAELEKAFEALAAGESRDGIDDTIRGHVEALRTEIEKGLTSLR
jgi:HPt (histidine-containing phosphotransfer) domain-containing protein